MTQNQSWNSTNGESEPDNSGICAVLRILGAKWAFLVLDELMRGPQRFNELKRRVSVIKTQSLTDTLRHLEQNGLVRRDVFPTVPVTVQYSLTEKGSDFQAALKEMEKWGQKWGSTVQE